ncbi:hypothetical protein GCM10010182_00400 [Actinomadura cremea]|nr:hypothetical protein GCM10010182_00400 [Actinomadura cremea]
MLERFDDLASALLAADQHAGDLAAQLVPGITDAARHPWAFLTRAVHHLAEEAKIQQFLHIGTGPSTGDNAHAVAQRAAPASRIGYVYNAPVALSHARVLLLTSTPQGATACISSDARHIITIMREASEVGDDSGADRSAAGLFLGGVGRIRTGRP